MTKEDDFGTWAVIGAVGAAAVGFLISALGQIGPPKFSGQSQVNSYQATYTPPPPPSKGCGCSAGR